MLICLEGGGCSDENYARVCYNHALLVWSASFPKEIEVQCWNMCSLCR